MVRYRMDKRSNVRGHPIKVHGSPEWIALGVTPEAAEMLRRANAYEALAAVLDAIPTSLDLYAEGRNDFRTAVHRARKHLGI